MLLCTEAWRLLLYCFIDDLVAVGRGEVIDTMPVPIMAVGLLQPFRSSAQMHDDNFTCIYRFISFHLSFYIVFTTACTHQKSKIKLFNQINHQSDVPELDRKLPIPVGIRLITAPFCHIIACSWEFAVPRNAIMLFL